MANDPSYPWPAFPWMAAFVAKQIADRIGMLDHLMKLARLPRKLMGQAKLLRADPERFARNLMQSTHPDLFQQRLIDLVNAVPMHVRYDASSRGGPVLNVLDSNWSMSGMTGGPNTVINLACRVARHGVKVRLVATTTEPNIDRRKFRRHTESLMGHADFPTIDIVSAANPDLPLPIGPNDLFLATHWSTAQQLKDVLPGLPINQFFYMLQEFEPGFYGWSSNFALALETFGLDFWPIVNQRLLADYLLALPHGRLNDPVMRKRALVFEPAVDQALFHPPIATAPARPKRLLFYARPTNTRNMFGLGFKALCQAAASPEFAGWEFLSIGSRDSLTDMPLGSGHILRRAPWMDYTGYAALLREADLLLCPMMSPHTSYPVLEMIASGGLAVTNTFATKTAAALHEIAPNIIAVPPTTTGLTQGLLQGARQINTRRPSQAPSLNMPRDWAASLDPIAERVAEICRALTHRRVMES